MRRILGWFGSIVAASVMLPQLTAVERHTSGAAATPAAAVQATAADHSRQADSPSPHPEAGALEQALIALRWQQQNGGWPRVNAKTLAPGRSHPAVVELRQRLLASGELSESNADAANPSMYDAPLQEAVRGFQFHNALKETGIADAATIAAMNVPLATRIHQLEVNVDRWRRLPADLGARHVWINIPSFQLVARENGKPVLQLKVVVGKAGTTQTPVFSSEMTTVIFSPYWHIPDSILTKETAPLAARDPGYLSRNAIEVHRVGRAGTPVDPASVDWSNPDEVRRLALRQRPGPRNSLGQVKFLLPNDHGIYLHDTPSVRLFSRPARAFSHGCIRVDDPEKLAEYVLRDPATWDEPRIQRAMASGVEQQVKLNESIPVHIVYFTAWVDERGGLHFAPDIYKYDR
jgi:L,D-transpeptidase YcbB